ncbi:RidA family protein [Streptomyces sp. E11-3]|uniref:RidA family protein n=1 Tax=Streptomyces sp. E11-3 TaxID=3110112 RepID=UPI00397F1FE8
MTSDAIRRVQSGSPWEESFGFARAVAAGDRVVVGGTTSFEGRVLHGEGDPYEQARRAFSHALAAIGEFGLGAESVIRTRMYLTHARDVDAVGRAHQEFFDSVRPVTTMVVVSGFVDSRILVEVELEAFDGPSDAEEEAIWAAASDGTEEPEQS